MIDIHAHILPGIDDGAKEIYDTLAMAELAVESGVRAVVATPHCNLPGMYENFFKDEYIKIFTAAKQAIEDEGIPLELYPGMEVFATDDLPDLLVNKKIMPINQSRYVLIEFHFEEDPDFVMDVLKRVKDVGAKPVIAHAERYEFVQEYPQLVYEMRKEGYVIQANKGSFMGRFGKTAKHTAYELLEHNLINVVASDAHSPHYRTTYLRDAYEELENYLPKQIRDILFRQNPARICANQAVIVQQPVPFL